MLVEDADSESTIDERELTLCAIMGTLRSSLAASTNTSRGVPISSLSVFSTLVKVCPSRIALETTI